MMLQINGLRAGAHERPGIRASLTDPFIEIVRTNTRAAFDNVHELLGAKSPPEFFELSTAQMRKQFEIVSGQNNELCALTQEMATEAAGAIKTGSAKAFNKAS